MPSSKIRMHKRSPLSPISHGSYKLSPKDIVVRTGNAKFTSLPQQRKQSVKTIKDVQSPAADNSETVFIWHKKVEKETENKIPIEQLKKNQKRRAEDNARELIELKRRRKEREKIRCEIRERKYEEERRKIAETELCWNDQQVEEFFLKQVPLRSQIRLKQGRAKPIDIFTRYTTAVNLLDIENIETEDPLHHMKDLSEEDLEDLCEDIKVYKKVHQQPNYQNFWNRMEKIVNFMLSFHGNSSQGRLRPLNSKIEEEINSILRGKTTNQLEEKY